MPLIDASSYYEEFHGHDCEQLADVLNTLRAHKKSIVFFAGDSSLDNKEWVKEEASALNGYEHALHPAMIKMDVCYWVNRTLKERMPGVAALNTAAEESTVMQRVAGLFSDGQLTSQDGFIRNNITENGYLVVSVGGNDIALEPSMATVANTVALTRIACDEAIEDGFAWGYQHFLLLLLMMSLLLL
ncbi:unnamed protein product [Polarella glacialis]|nr:unnamed protein product [Polarella glacialis]